MPRLFRETREIEEQKTKKKRERGFNTAGGTKRSAIIPSANGNISRAGEAGSYLLKVSRERFADGKKKSPVENGAGNKVRSPYQWKRTPEAVQQLASTRSYLLLSGVSIKLCPIFSSLRHGATCHCCLAV